MYSVACIYGYKDRYLKVFTYATAALFVVGLYFSQTFKIKKALAVKPILTVQLYHNFTCILFFCHPARAG
jgi:hypothetical protein